MHRNESKSSRRRCRPIELGVNCLGSRHAGSRDGRKSRRFPFIVKVSDKEHETGLMFCTLPLVVDCDMVMASHTLYLLVDAL